MSPRAACRLATLGFTRVYDYTPGKLDWLARGLPRDGDKSGELRAIDFTRDDVVTCALDDRIADVQARVAGSPYRFAFVVSADGVLLGRLRRAALEGDGTLSAEQAMEAGPSTVRADTSRGDLEKRLSSRDLTTAVVSDPEGRLLGVVRRQDLADA